MGEFKSMRHWVGVAVLLALGACGGGSGGGSSSAPAASTVGVSGVASKGLLKNAIVTAYAVDSTGGRTSTVLASGRTNPTTGAYSLAGLPANAVVLIEVTTDADTRMADEASGADIVPASDFKLRAAIVLPTTGSDSLQITPYSEMAVVIAETNLGFTKQTVQASNEQVVSYAGSNVLTTAPTFDSSNQPTNAAALLLAAVSKMAENGDLGCTGAAAAKVKCVVEAMAAAGPADSALASTLESAKTAAKPVAYNGTVPTVVIQDGPLPIDPTIQTVVDAAKALVSSVRSIGMALQGEGDTALKPRLTAVVDAVEASVAPVDDSTVALVDAATQVVAVLDSPQDSLGNFPQGGGFRLSASNGSVVGCTLYSDANFSVASTSYDNAGRAGCRLTLQTFPASGGNAAHAAQHRLLITKVSADQYTVSTALVKQTGTLTNGVFTRDSSAATALNGSALANVAIVTRVPSGSTYSSFTLAGDLAPGWTLGEAQSTKSTVDIALQSFTVSTGVTRLALKGLVSAYSGDNLLSSVSLKEGSYVQARTTLVDGDITLVDSDVSAHKAHLVLEAVATGGASVIGTLDASDFLRTNVRWGPTKGSFAGTVSEPNGTTPLFDGVLTLTMPTDPASRYLGWTAKLDGAVLVSGSGSEASTLTLNILLTQSATVAGNGSFSGRYTQGGHTFLLEGAVVEATPASNTLTFSALSGVTFTAHPDDANENVVLLKKGDAVVGRFTRNDSKLVYADGSYEQF